MKYWSMVHRPVISAPLRNFSEMQNSGAHSRPAGSRSAIFQDPQETEAHIKCEGWAVSLGKF